MATKAKPAANGPNWAEIPLISNSGGVLGHLARWLKMAGAKSTLYLHPAPCTLYLIPCTLCPAPCTLYPVPRRAENPLHGYTLYPVPRRAEDPLHGILYPQIRSKIRTQFT